MIVQSPVWLASTVTVAVDVPADVVEAPTVHFAVVDDVKLTAPLEVALALIENV